MEARETGFGNACAVFTGNCSAVGNCRGVAWNIGMPTAFGVIFGTSINVDCNGIRFGIVWIIRIWRIIRAWRIIRSWRISWISWISRIRWISWSCGISWICGIGFFLGLRQSDGLHELQMKSRFAFGRTAIAVAHAHACSVSARFRTVCCCTFAAGVAARAIRIDHTML